ncbi:hypothetical protein V8F63_06605 [Brevundimonas sp. LF-1]|uniref:hypothetical protein n=1 Tax=Brevundimonas sp. LF-1 TaxID=3126100 RepID=UPI0030E5A9C0
MSQHNIVGSEAFSNRQYVLITHVRSSGSRRRRARAMTAYVVVAALALSAGAAAAAFALGPFLVGTPASLGYARGRGAFAQPADAARPLIRALARRTPCVSMSDQCACKCE